MDVHAATFGSSAYPEFAFAKWPTEGNFPASTNRVGEEQIMAVKRAPSKKTRADEGRKPKKNPLISAGVETVDYKDINLLRTFISDRGKIRSRRVTGLTPQQQRQVAVAVKNAREMALLPFTSSSR